MLFLSQRQKQGPVAGETLQGHDPAWEPVLENLPGMVWLADAAGRLRWANAAWRSATGLNPSELSPEAVLELVHPDDRARAWPEETGTGGLPAAAEYRLRMRVGYRWVKERVRPWFDASGRAGGFIGTTVDVHDRREHERRLALAALRQTALAHYGRYILEHGDGAAADAEALRLMVEHTGLDGVWLLRPEGEGAAWVVAARHGPATLTAEPELTPGRCLASPSEARLVAYPGEADAFPFSAAWMKATGRAFGIATPADPSAPRRGWFVGVASHPPSASAPRNFIRDLAAIYAVADARREAERKLREGDERALQIQKLEAVGLLAGGVAHDFNNLLTAIRCFAELLRDDISDETQKGRLDDILHAAGRASHLVRQLLSFSRQEVVQIESIDLHGLVDGLRGFIRSIVSEHVRLEFQLGAGAAWCQADPKQIEQVLFNLCLNARDVMSIEGCLTITVGPGPTGEDGERRVRLSVADTGPGVPIEAQGHLFQPFFTTKAKGRGTGLGLATSRNIARSFGGDLSFETWPGRGTVFHLDLPEIADPLASLPEEETNPAPARRARILLVEDDDLVRAVTLMLAESLGHQVTAHADPTQALAWAQQGGLAEVDVVITDVVMPEMNGHELAKRLLALRPTLPVLYMSGYVDDPATLAAIHAPGVAFLAKPFSNQDFTARLNTVLEQLPD